MLGIWTQSFTLTRKHFLTAISPGQHSCRYHLSMTEWRIVILIIYIQSSPQVLSNFYFAFYVMGQIKVGTINIFILTSFKFCLFKNLDIWILSCALTNTTPAFIDLPSKQGQEKDGMSTDSNIASFRGSPCGLIRRTWRHLYSIRPWPVCWDLSTTASPCVALTGLSLHNQLLFCLRLCVLHGKIWTNKKQDKALSISALFFWYQGLPHPPPR